MLLKINLAHKSDADSIFEIHVRPTGSEISRKWLQKLKEALRLNLQIEKNFCWVGFPDNPRQLDVLCQQLNQNIQTVNQFSSAGGWNEKNYHISDVFSVQNVIKDNDVNHDLMNSIHHHFEILQGQVWNISPWFLTANDSVRFAIRQLNNLCHEIEILIKAKKMQKENPERVSPATIVSLINASRFELQIEDYDEFTLDRGFGKVFMHYCQTGKTHWESFVDDDKDIDRANISGLRYFSPEFNIEWGPNYDDTMSWWSEKKLNYKNWLIQNNYNPGDKTLSHGWLQIGQVDIEKIYTDVGSNKLSDVHRVLSNYLDISKITVEDGLETVSQSYELIKNNNYLLNEQLKNLSTSYTSFCEKND
jgi:hypothetical protein